MQMAFVTGSTGFLGLNLIEELAKGDWEIHALHLPNENLSYLSRFPVHAVSGDILDMDSLLKVMPEKVDAVFHLAGDTSTWSKNNDRQRRINVDGTVNVLDAAIKEKAGRFIFTSSISAFGFHDGPISEDTVSTAMESGVNYHMTKYMAEQEIKKHAGEIRTVILNPCNVIGPYDQKNWAQTIKTVYQNRLPGYPPGLGTFAHVRDIVRAHIAAAEIESPRGQYVIGGTPARFEEIFNTIETILGKQHSGKVISKSKLWTAMYLFKLKSWIDKKEPLITQEKYKRLIGTQLCDDRAAIRDLGLKRTSLQQMFTDSYEWLLRENLLNQ